MNASDLILPPCGQAALDLVKRGWHVFPANLADGGKRSHKKAEHSGGRKWGATTDLEEVRRDWRRWPDAGLGLVTGPKSGFFVVEADTAEGHSVDGISNLAALIEEHGGWPDTIEAESPSGSWHAYFRWPEAGGIANSASLVAPGVDVRGDGGMVIAPPTMRPGRAQPYLWKNPPGLFDLAECPAWLLDLCRKPASGGLGAQARATAPQAGTSRTTAWVQAALRAELGNVLSAPPGRRNADLNAAAFALGQIVGSGALDEDDVRARLVGAALSIGLEDAEARATVASGMAAGMREPRTPPERPDAGRATADAEAQGDRPEGDAPRGGQEGRTKGQPEGDATSPTEAASPIKELTEDGVARAFTARFRNQLRFDHDVEQWHEWTGDRWKPDGTGLAFSWCREMARDMSGEAKENEKVSVRKRSFAAGVEAFARADRAHAVSQDAWDQDRFLLGVPKGVVDLRTGKLMAPDLKHGITKLAAVAPAERDDCPVWKAFLLEASGGDPETVAFLRRWCGYCLTGDTREHALIFLYGPGGNGKSVFLNTVSRIVGGYATTAAMDTFTASRGDKHPTDLALLRGARMVSASETEEGRSWAEARIKQMTGGDPITARFMRQNFFTYQPQFKLTIVGNHAPALASVDDAARRRFNVVSFIHKPAQPDRELESKLVAEWPAILRWMIDGTVEWLDKGLMQPASVLAATASYFSEQDMTRRWLEEVCTLTPANPSHWETAASLFKSWSDFAKDNGEEPGTAKSLAARLRRNGLRDCAKWWNGRTVRVWEGVEIVVARREDARG